MKIKFTVQKALVVESVKTETYIKGRVDEASQEGAAKYSYNETIGDIETHERKLSKDYVHGCERLKSVFVDFFIPDHKTVGDSSISVTYTSGTGDAAFSIELPRRFNGALTDALANYSYQYIEEYMTYQWWLTTGNQKSAEPLSVSMKDLEIRIRKCFTISTPSVSTAKYEEVKGGIFIDDGDTEFNGSNG